MKSRLTRIAVVAAWAFATLGLAAAPAAPAECTSVQDQLTKNKAAVEVTCMPAGATSIGPAESTQGGSGGTTKYAATIPAKVGTTFEPKTPGYPWAGMIAKNSSGGQVGKWATRLQTVPGGEKETRREELEKQLEAAKISVNGIEVELEEAKTLVSKIEGELNSLPNEQQEVEEREAAEKAEKEQKEHEAAEKAEKEREAKEKAEKELKEREAREKAEKEAKELEEKEKAEKEGEELEEPPFSTFHKGVDGGGWGESNELKDYAKLGPNPSVRLENPGNTGYLTSRGYYVVYLLGHYSSGGVKSINVSTYVNEAKSVHAQNPSDAIEVLNEPGGNWFWGSGAESQENATAYDRLLKAVHEALPTTVIYASADGGHAGDNTWLKRMLAGDPNVPSYVTAFTNHPYDGSGASPESTLVHFSSVEQTHALTGKPVDITEYGRPLLASTGDSPKSTEAQQAKADGAMVKKARSVGYVLGVEIYGYRGDSSPCYAIFKGSGEPRPAVAAIAGA